MISFKNSFDSPWSSFWVEGLSRGGLLLANNCFCAESGLSVLVRLPEPSMIFLRLILRSWPWAVALRLLLITGPWGKRLIPVVSGPPSSLGVFSLPTLKLVGLGPRFWVARRPHPGLAGESRPTWWSTLGNFCLDPTPEGILDLPLNGVKLPKIIVLLTSLSSLPSDPNIFSSYLITLVAFIILSSKLWIKSSSPPTPPPSPPLWLLWATVLSLVTCPV